MESKTFTEAEKFYADNRERLLSVLKEEQKGEIEYQTELDQVAVWFKGFSLCYQNSDMNGAGKGEPHWNNPGADDGVTDLREILEKDARFQPLIEKDEYWSYEYLEQLVQDFCSDFAEENNIADYFQD